MSFHSILFESPEDRGADSSIGEPGFFTDLNCDQIVTAITGGKEEYDLKPFFHAPLRRLDAITYRHEVMRDLEAASLREAVDGFAQAMRDIRDHLQKVNKLRSREQQQAWFIDAIEVYCQTIKSLAHAVAQMELKSCGFQRFCDYLSSYTESAHFNSLSAGVERLKAALGTVEYCVQIQGDSFTVRRCRGETDYSAEVEATFEKFKQGAVRDYRVKFGAGDDMNHVEAKILEFVAKLHPELFGPLEEFCDRCGGFIDQTIAEFDREVQFYLAYLDYIAVLRSAGLQFCYPCVSDSSQEVYDYDGFDIALAHKLVAQKLSVVCNDFNLDGNERVLVVSGPNQGGKTTFARAFGQLHYLASIGCPVPGREARLFLFDRMFTHFEKEEKVDNLRGKLEDDLIRVHQIIDRSTPRSIIILNEVFTSTTIRDETLLSERVMERILALRALCVWVTFVDELASFAPQTVSMVSTVAVENPALRTFKIVRRPADGLAYAMAIAQKYGLTYDSIMERIKP
jgi:DNA mismatch repair protein MutS